MESKLILISKTKFFHKFNPLIFGSIGLFMLYLCQSLIKELFKEIYPQLTTLFFCLLTGIIGLSLIRLVYSYNIFHIYTDKILIKSIFGNIKKIIPIKEIISWKEIERVSKSHKWLEFFFFTEKSKFIISSDEYENYTKLKVKIARNLPQEISDYKKNNWWKIILISIFCLASLLFFYSVYNYYDLRNNKLKETNLITINDELLNEPKIIKGSKGHRSIDIILKSKPEFTFKISNESYHAIYARDFVKDSKIGDSISIKILKEDYNKKIIKKTPLTFLEKSISFTIINVFEVNNKKRSYLTLRDYNLALQNNESLYWFSGILGVFFLFLTIIGIVEFEKIGTEQEISE